MDTIELGRCCGLWVSFALILISASSGYEEQLRELALRGTAIGETLRLLTA